MRYKSDEYCPHCDNHFIIAAKTPETEGRLVVEVEQERGHEHKMFRDERERDRAPTLQQEVQFQSAAMMDPIRDDELDGL